DMNSDEEPREEEAEPESTLPVQDLVSQPLTRAKFLRFAGAASGLSLAAGVFGARTSLGGELAAHQGKGAAPTVTNTSRPGKGIDNGPSARKLRHKQIGFLNYTSADQNNELWTLAIEEANRRAGLDWRFKLVDGENTTSVQAAAITAFIDDKVDAIILGTIAPPAVATQLAEAKAKGIPVFGLWCYPPIFKGLTLNYQATPMTGTAALCGYMFNQLDLRYPKGYQIAVVDCTFAVLKQRRLGLNALKSIHPLARVVASAFAESSDINGSTETIVRGFLSRFPDLKAIWTSYPTSGPAAATAVLTARRPHIRVYSNDAEKPGLIDVGQPGNPIIAMPWDDWDWQGYYLVNYMLEYFAGHNPGPLVQYETPTPFVMLTKANAKTTAKGKGVAGGFGWSFLDGAWKEPLVKGWKSQYRL
ncbi:MAG: sugar ABC transporter substrate-binding protein, partial [Acidimicrobiales bacterium]